MKKLHNSFNYLIVYLTWSIPTPINWFHWQIYCKAA